MHNHTNRTREEVYVVQVDGIIKSEHRIFIEALKRGLELKGQYPRSDVKLLDAREKAMKSTCHNELPHSAFRQGAELAYRQCGDHYGTAHQRGCDPPPHQRLAGAGGGMIKRQ